MFLAIQYSLNFTEFNFLLKIYNIEAYLLHLCLKHQTYKCVKLIPAIASFLITIGASTINTLSHTGASTRLTNRQIMAINAAASWTISSVVLTTTQTAAKVIVKIINKTKSIITHQGRFD